jgi:hypothetical protein
MTAPTPAEELIEARIRLDHLREQCINLEGGLRDAMLLHLHALKEVLRLERLLDPPERRVGESMDRREVTEATVRNLIREAYGRS